MHGSLSCGDDPLRKEFAAQRVAGFEGLRARFRRAVTEGDLPINADVDTLANFVQTVNFGLTVQASTGATRKDLLCVITAVLQALPKLKLRKYPNVCVFTELKSHVLAHCIGECFGDLGSHSNLLWVDW